MTDYHVLAYEDMTAEDEQAMHGHWVQRNSGGNANGACVSMLKEVPHWNHLAPLIIVPVYFH